MPDEETTCQSCLELLLLRHKPPSKVWYNKSLGRPRWATVFAHACTISMLFSAKTDHSGHAVGRLSHPAFISGPWSRKKMKLPTVQIDNLMLPRESFRGRFFHAWGWHHHIHHYKSIPHGAGGRKFHTRCCDAMCLMWELWIGFDRNCDGVAALVLVVLSRVIMFSRQPHRNMQHTLSRDTLKRKKKHNNYTSTVLMTPPPYPTPPASTGPPLQTPTPNAQRPQTGHSAGLACSSLRVSGVSSLDASISEVVPFVQLDGLLEMCKKDMLQIVYWI